MLNRAKDSNASLYSVVTGGAYSAYGSNNWGWRDYGNGPVPGSIGTQRVKEIFLEELNKATNGYAVSYPVKSFKGNGKTNTYW